MMSKIAVIYKSKYGYTKRYAQWIAQELDAVLLDAVSVKPAQLMDYDIVIYGGGLYAGGIDGIGLVAKNPCKALVVFTVGLADPAVIDYTDILIKSRLESVKVFHLRGGIDYEKLSVVHKGMMAVLNKVLSKKNETELSEEDKAILATYGQKIDFVDESAIAPIIAYAQSQLKG
ncbi:MAG: flavodoxin domain-containing protein [Defluviitaleaceae bacterium]|nr:flavodoxin domain-containing protein [Defluviitaleaceae bacterium]